MRRNGERYTPDEVHDTPQQTGNAKLTQLADGLPGKNLSTGVVSEEPMQVIEAFEQDPEGQSCHRAQNDAVAERQFGSPEYHAVIVDTRSEEHTSELQSLTNLVCRLLLEKK